MLRKKSETEKRKSSFGGEGISVKIGRKEKS